MHLIILDDDPTGIQTVHGCKLITKWDAKTVKTALSDECGFFYMLTNTRALTADEAALQTRSAMEAVLNVIAEDTSKYIDEGLVFISRSDSCLRGHFPLETDVMRQVLEENDIKAWDKTPFVPAFIEAGRVTINGIHYMKEGDRLVPVSETEFARDNVFHYSTSVLTDYIREKGANPADYVIVNAQSYDELHAFCNCLNDIVNLSHDAIIVRSSSSFPKAMARVEDRDLLSREELLKPSASHQGVIIVGSHVKKTTRQLNNLLAQDGVTGIELSVEKILTATDEYLNNIIGELASLGNTTPVLFTSREEVRIDDAEARQHLGQRISDFLVEIVRRLPFTPSYLIAKGGITSHDILTKGLNVSIATVMGQLVPNVPCVMTDRFPYIIFPGNVGNDDSLAEAYCKLR